MSLKLYLTTDAIPCDDETLGYGVDIWRVVPSLIEGKWEHDDFLLTSMYGGYVGAEDLAALGFPPPGEVRVIEVGEYKEVEANDNS